MENKLTIWTCANKIYEKYIPLFVISHLLNNKNTIIEIGIEDELEEKTRVNVEQLKEYFPDRLFIRKIDFKKYEGMSHGSIRFINEPINKSKYVYISDIDIICLDKDIADIHIKQMSKTGLPYCNKIRSGTRKLTGLHFQKWDTLYPLPDITKMIAEGVRRDDARIICDEIMLHEILIAKGIELNYNLKFRPVHGIHISPQRAPLPSALVPGWEMTLDMLPDWVSIKKSEIFIKCYPNFFNAIKKIIQQIDETFDYLQKVKYKGVVCTAIVSDYDGLKDPYIISKDFEYICFTTNRTITSSVWRIIYIDLEKGQDPVRLAREIKINYTKYISTNYKYVVWIDGSIEIRCDLNEFIEENDIDNNDIITITHPHRKGIYEEAARCKLQQKDYDEVIDKQINRYREEGFPENMGLISSGIMIRHNSKRVKKFMEMWWDEIKNGSRRDQLSFNYVLWKNPIKVKLVPYASVYDEVEGDRFILKKHHNEIL